MPSLPFSIAGRSPVIRQVDIDDGSGGAVDINGDQFESGPIEMPGAGLIVASVTSDDNGALSHEVDWLDENDTLLDTTAPSTLSNVTDGDIDEATIRLRSGRWVLLVSDDSGAQNRIHGSANAH